MLKYDRTLIFEGRDDYGPVEIVEKDGLRSMHFGTSEKQSEMSLSNPYTLTVEYIRLMSMALLFHTSPKSVLCLGLGGGSLPKFIWKYFPRCHLDLVEISPLVADLCYRYFFLPRSPRLHIYVTDAFDFIKSCGSQYDLIFIDLFIGEGMSPQVGEEDFFKLCQKRLKDKNSVLIWNTWRETKVKLMTESIQKLYENFGKNLLIFPDTHKRNNVFLVFSKLDYALFQIMQRAQKLKNKTGLDYPQMLLDEIFITE